MYQVAKNLETSHDALVDLLEPIEHFLGHIDIYTQIPHTPTLGDMVGQDSRGITFHTCAGDQRA